MTISNAIPVQFWLNGQQVFNEKIEDGIEPKPFYQKFNKDDSVKLQFTDTVLKVYRLTIFSCDDEQLAQLDFTSELVESEYVYSLEFDFETQGVDSGLVWLQISEFEYTYDLSGAIEDLMEEVNGTVTFTPAALVFEIDGAIEDLMEEVTGTVEILAPIVLENSSLDIIITAVKVDGVDADITGGALPCGTGSGVTFTTKKTGVYDVEVTYSSTAPGQHIRVTGSDGTPECIGSGPTPLTFTAVVLEPALTVNIEVADGGC